MQQYAPIWPRDELRFWAPTQGGTVFIAGAATFSPPPDPDRRTLIFSADGNNVCTVLPFSLLGTTFGGLVLSTAAPVLILTYEQHGPIVTEAWQKTGPIGSNVWWLGSSMSLDPRIYGYPEAYLEPSPIPDRAPPSLRRMRLVPARRQSRRSGIYSRISSHHPNLFDG